MVDITSVSNPIGPEAEEVSAALTLPGDKGNIPTEESLAERCLVVRDRRPAVETVIGDDDRTRILETTTSPWRRICALEIEGSNGSNFIGTGWLVGPRTVITAGHCVHYRDMGGWARSIRVAAGRNGGDIPFGQLTATRFSAIDAWRDREDPDFDYGAIHLDADLGANVGWFAVGALSNADLLRARVNISGYPGSPGRGQQQWFHTNGVLYTTERRVFYDVDTTNGQSGAPVWVYPDGGAEPVVVAIHAYGTSGTPPSLNIDANSAPRIIPEVLSLIEQWRS